jgi:hypothetical protein
MSYFDYLKDLPPTLWIAVVLLVILMIGSIAKRMIKLAIIAAVIILFVTFVYPLFNY